MASICMHLPTVSDGDQGKCVMEAIQSVVTVSVRQSKCFFSQMYRFKAIGSIAMGA